MARRGVCGNTRGRRDSSKIKTREGDVTLSQEIIKMTCFGFMELGAVKFLSSFVICQPISSLPSYVPPATAQGGYCMHSFD